MKRISTLRPATLLLVVAVIALAILAGCSQKSVDPTDMTTLTPTFNTPDNSTTPTDTAMDRRGTQTTALATAAQLKWPTSMSDFRFPFRGIENGCLELWKITNGYGTGLHTHTYYPAAGYYSLDLERVGTASGGSCVLTMARGIVTHSGWMNGYGWCVVVDHDAGHTGKGYKSILGHLRSDPNQYVKVGDDLAGGTFIGYCGNTGGNYVDHIHISIWKNNVTCLPNGISGYASLYKYSSYYSFNPLQTPPRSSCNCR